MNKRLWDIQFIHDTQIKQSELRVDMILLEHKLKQIQEKYNKAA
jgi:hypothetical protein